MSLSAFSTLFKSDVKLPQGSTGDRNRGGKQPVGSSARMRQLLLLSCYPGPGIRRRQDISCVEASVVIGPSTEDALDGPAVCLSFQTQLVS